MNIRLAKASELDWIGSLAAAEGWNPGLHDMDAFYAQDPQGWLVGEIDGTPIGCVSCVRYDGGFGFLGFYIVIPSHRGQGYGLPLFQEAIKRLDGFTIGLDGVIDQQLNYRKSGFELAYSNIRFEYVNKIQGSKDPHVINAAPNHLRALEEYDFRHFGYPRPAFLARWISLPEAKTKIYLKDGEIKGYGTIRQCDTGYKIGPLFAVNEAVADELLRCLCSWAPLEEYIYLDVPERNGRGLFLAAKYNMNSVFGTARMYRGTAPGLPVPEIFGVTTFELG